MYIYIYMYIYLPENIAINMTTCFDAGMENFIFEVCLFIYCTASTLLSSLQALKYDIFAGQKVEQNSRHVPYNTAWKMILIFFNVADDMGKLRLQFKLFHKPLFGWKGSFVVTQVSAERKVSYDHGLEGSIAEDCFFSMVAMKHGYTFDFIEGKKPLIFTMYFSLNHVSAGFPRIVVICMGNHADYVIAGIYYGCKSSYVLLLINRVSTTLTLRNSAWRLVLYLTGALMTIPFNIIIENAAVLVGMFGRKDQFYIDNWYANAPRTPSIATSFPMIYFVF
uniref:Glyco_trans_2-like domain-containing protein n=1 Tax=Heterorhabditis bacteriophora TaxID=37862 RepID=A0A1I7WZ14_HETBA